jgi:hypothetical protein
MAKLNISGVPLLVYLLMMTSVFIGFAFLTGTAIVNPTESILYASGVLLEEELWGGLLFTSASASIVGFITRRDYLIRLGGIGGFFLWLFASISLAVDGHFYVLLSVGLLHLAFHVYVYLMNSLGTLRSRA